MSETQPQLYAKMTIIVYLVCKGANGVVLTAQLRLASKARPVAVKAVQAV